MNSQPSINISEFTHIVSHFDGNNNDRDDLAALPVAAMLINAAGLQDQTVFAFNNNRNEPNRGNQADLMRESAAFAQRLGIETLDYDGGHSAVTSQIIERFNSGDKVLSIEGGPMEMVYRALAQTNPANLKNITLLSHSSWNERRAVGERPGGGTPRTWADIQSDFPAVQLIDIRDQNGPDYEGPAGFYSEDWSFLDRSSDPVLQEARALMNNVLGPQINDASDSGMHFFALTGNDQGTPLDVEAFLAQNPVAFAGSGIEVVPESQNNVASATPEAASTTPLYQMEQGRLVLEAESSELEGNWEQVEVSGRTAVLYDGPNSFSQKPSGQTLSYEFVADEAGIFDISLYGGRLNSAQSPGESLRSDLGNDVYVEVIDVETGAFLLEPTKQYIQLDFSNAEYRWGNTLDRNGQRSQSKINLQADRQYRLEITGRSDGFILDRITLGNDGRFRDADRPESPLVGGTIPEPEPQPELRRFEAENFELSGEYRPERIAIASGESVISLIGGEIEGTGSAAFEFDGVSGLYNVRIAYFDESDGVGQLRLEQDGETLLDLALDQELGSVIAKPQTSVTEELSNIQVQVGDRFELFAQEDGVPGTGEHMRIDYLEFIPVETASANVGFNDDSLLGVSQPTHDSLPGGSNNGSDSLLAVPGEYITVQRFL